MPRSMPMTRTAVFTSHTEERDCAPLLFACLTLHKSIGNSVDERQLQNTCAPSTRNNRSHTKACHWRCDQNAAIQTDRGPNQQATPSSERAPCTQAWHTQSAPCRPATTPHPAYLPASARLVCAASLGSPRPVVTFTPSMWLQTGANFSS